MIKPSLVISLVSLGMWGCSSLVTDPSIPATEANDYTLMMSACESTPNKGMDICMVSEGSEIDSSWKIILPFKGINVLGGEVDIYYKDIHHQYPIESPVTEIYWKDFLGKSIWVPELDGEVLALALVKYLDSEGVESVAKFRGIAKLVVTKKGYSRIPLGSAFSTWKVHCDIEYSTSGRGSLKCK